MPDSDKSDSDQESDCDKSGSDQESDSDKNDRTSLAGSCARPVGRSFARSRWNAGLPRLPIAT